jgi:hypothetical protein
VKHRIIGTLIPVLILVAWLGRADALAAQPPVRVDSCSLWYRDINYGRRSETFTTVGPLNITFTNESSHVVDGIQFAIALPQGVTTINDAGKFSPGVPITHQYGNLNGKQWPYQAKAQPECSVVSVKFADGSVWPATTP